MPLSRLPLNALRAFDVTARLGSMSAAAGELGVTHGAVSRHIKALEAQLGLPLLERLPRAVALTQEGAQLAASLADAFDQIQLAVSRVQPGPLTLSCSATIMMYWLIPRLETFKQAHPAVELRLNISYGEVDFVRDGISVAIRTSMYRPPATARARPLIAEEIGPVCHPDYAARLGLAGPDDLARARILATATRPQAWAEWGRAIGRPDLGIVPQESYGHFYLVIQAAACGLGLALAPRLLVESEIRAGHLAAPFGFTPGPHRLELWIAEHLQARADLRCLVAWIARAMGPDGDRPG
ncbi:transcriptional regulator, LysR family [Methylobacterium sp. 4-46]|uniref:LysR substrate-binding domain-containing protein n=1 Tax=unclassified Methylobacterium TaxID=2615210 RepID=UPI000152E61C|nr:MULTISPECIES: LysR substrate-binding domain-containing protein [Methylobacterium]ACA16220.1 transcriptional regulator, LysR family [Methylobacterium sp. 4-46]WFT81928.1 LysR substrate-binding domain-containing protein [Methylobacterium nodulans]